MSQGIESTIFDGRLVIGIPNDIFKNVVKSDHNIEIDVDVIGQLILDIKKYHRLDEIKKVCLMNLSKFRSFTECDEPTAESLLFDFLLKDEK